MSAKSSPCRHVSSLNHQICLIKVKSIFLKEVCCGQYFGIQVPKALVSFKMQQFRVHAWDVFSLSMKFGGPPKAGGGGGGFPDPQDPSFGIAD